MPCTSLTPTPDQCPCTALAQARDLGGHLWPADGRVPEGAAGCPPEHESVRQCVRRPVQGRHMHGGDSEREMSPGGDTRPGQVPGTSSSRVGWWLTRGPRGSRWPGTRHTSVLRTGPPARRTMASGHGAASADGRKENGNRGGSLRPGRACSAQPPRRPRPAARRPRPVAPEAPPSRPVLRPPAGTLAETVAAPTLLAAGPVPRGRKLPGCGHLHV